MNKELAPIIFFAYKRPDHAKTTIESLQRNELAQYSNLFIFQDGYKDEKDRPGVEATKKYIEQISGFDSIEINNRDHHLGLGNNVTDGITQILNRFGRAIIVEDDLILSPYFLNYMNDGLDIYKDDENVASINAFVFAGLSKYKKVLPPYFFMPKTSSWGWATWQRAWRDYEFDATKLIERIKCGGGGG